MLDILKENHRNRRKEIIERLSDFKKNKYASNSKFLEEMAFCVFAANSSAKMGLRAAELLKDVLSNGTLEDYKKATYKKVRFYNKRAEYLYFNKQIIAKMTKEITRELSLMDFNQRREFIRQFKGFGMKEASHLLRNLGYEGYCIIDKHVLNTLAEMNILDSNLPPKNAAEYENIEQKIKAFAEKENFNIDELDLAIWSMKTGEIIK